MVVLLPKSLVVEMGKKAVKGVASRRRHEVFRSAASVRVGKELN